MCDAEGCLQVTRELLERYLIDSDPPVHSTPADADGKSTDRALLLVESLDVMPIHDKTAALCFHCTLERAMHLRADRCQDVTRYCPNIQDVWGSQNFCSRQAV